MKVGVYICHCGINIAATVDIEEVRSYISTLPGVAVCRDYRYMCSDPGQELIKKDIKEYGLNRVVVASCSPRMHEPTFRVACEEAGLNPYCFEMANIREQCSWVHVDKEKATEKAESLVAAAVEKSLLLEPLKETEVDVTPTAMVIGGGIAGIQASLDIADSGFKVHLMEREPSIGGHMAQLDKTFPTLDCSACILTPKMVDAGSHPNIDLITYAEVEDVGGYVGNFNVKVKKKPRYIDEDKCTGCGLCAQACRFKDRFPSEFDVGMGKRSASYILSPYAVPAVYTMDPDNCLMVTRGKCGKATIESIKEGTETPPCIDACGPEAIDFEQREEIMEINVGAIIVATGYDAFNPSLKPEYGYDLYDNVITGLEFERLSSASGPTGGRLEINGEEPKKVAFIQCVGSRDRKGNEYCSRVCCMYTAKHAHLVKEKIPDAEVTIFYTDARAFGKGYDEFYERVKEEGATYLRRELDDPIEVVKENGTLYVKAHPHPPVEADMVTLATGTVPRADAGGIGNILKISRSADGFFAEAHPKLRPVDTPSDGIFLAGACQAPKDIPDAVAQAKAAASKACSLLAKGKVKAEVMTAKVNEDLCRGCGFCVDACPYDALELKTINRFGYMVEVASVNEVVCKGCGLCSGACLSGAIQQRMFLDDQILSAVSALGT
jgi:heterodisulfide reductase subunit A